MYRLFALLLAGLGLLTGCGTAETSVGAERSVGPAAIAAPTDDVVLTISGSVERPNADGRVMADRAGLESVGPVTATVFEPFVSAEMEFTGVSLAAVLQAAGVADDATLVLRALDDYEVSFTMAELVEDSALLVTRQADEPIAVADGGPIRVVFTDPDSPLGRNLALWIWSLAEIEVE
ncbi:MAG: molybdopterin-dependent oxidoreductase [Actinomycetota bacterium]